MIVVDPSNSSRFLRALLRVLLISILLLPFSVVRPAFVVHAATTIIVNSLSDFISDNGQCTLREAITTANTGIVSGTKVGECSVGSGDNIVDMTNISGIIKLTSSLPNISNNILFIGPTGTNLTISGDNRFRVFFVSNGFVRFENLTIADGKTEGG